MEQDISYVSVIDSKGFTLQPELGDRLEHFVKFCKDLEQSLVREVPNNLERVISAFREEISLDASGPKQKEDIALLTIKSVILDLVSQDWQLKVEDSKVQIYYPSSHHDSKEHIRRRHLIERNAQLKERSVQDFVKKMERRRLTTTGWHSIFSLMRDGKELSDKLALAKEGKISLGHVISPYLQFVEEEIKCEFTGLKLIDIWRYFRHTWVNAYKSLPGRFIMILVRDAAAPNHPVIGIVALGSSVVQQRARDQWIGWDATTFVDRLVQNPSAKLAKWLLNSLDRLFEGIYLKDLLEQGLCSYQDLKYPTDQVILKLREESELAIQRHRRFPDLNYKKAKSLRSNEINWEEQALTHLFKSKRCETLASLLSIRQTFQKYGLSQGTKEELTKVLKSTKVRKSIGQLIRNIKAEHVGVDMMDIIVCGAIAPYNLLLGGKLASMIMCSPKVVQYYKTKYYLRESIIASSMKGEPVQKLPHLVLLCTTSLYSVGSSQYNRIKIPAEEIGGKAGDKIEYVNLGLTEGFGSFHFSRETLQLMDVFLARTNMGRRVNSIFGEGVNPRMRKIRDALIMLGMPDDPILQHGNRRVVYGIALAKNFREILMGIHKRPIYIIPQSKPQNRTKTIVDYWQKRWLASRINTLGILEKVAQHSLTYPISHGAQVPKILDLESQLPHD